MSTRPMKVGGAVALLVLSACRDHGPESGPAPAPLAPNPNAVELPTTEEKADLLSAISTCEVNHRGLLLDLGGGASASRRRFGLARLEDLESVDRDGATFERVHQRELAFDVWLDRPLPRPSVGLRAHGGAARRIHTSVDGEHFGTLRLTAQETAILATRAAETPLAPGRHRIVLRFLGAPRASKEVLADLDWLRLSEFDDRPAAHAAPTREDILANVALDRTPKRSLVLRAPSTVRCALQPGSKARLQVAVGLWGTGSGVAEIALARDGLPRVTLETRKLTGGDRATWSNLSIDLTPYAGSLLGLEFTAVSATRAGRIAFGDPAIVRREEGVSRPRNARLAVLVVLAAVDRRRIPPWGPSSGLKTLAELARASVAFGNHRASTTVASAVLASLLTGLSPRAHGLEDATTLLAPEHPTLAELVGEASGQTAMFTGSPASFAPFGFNQGWDVFEAISPTKDFPAGEPLTLAARWLEQDLEEISSVPALVLVHARGGHPPWDVSREEAQRLKPSEYSGLIDPRRGGIVIGSMRESRRRSRRLLQDDWTRLRALSDASLARQDAALGRLVQVLKRKGLWDDTLLIVTSDVAPGDPPDFPFDPIGPLTEDRLILPLLIKFPGQRLSGQETLIPSQVEELAPTVLSFLDLRPNPDDLFRTALGRAPPVIEAHTATLPNRYSTRLGQRLLRARIGDVPTLCAFDIDPACAADVFDQELIAARALWEATFAAEQATRSLTPPDGSRRPVIADPETAAALVVWGDQP